VLLLTAAAAGDRLGRRRVLVAGLTLVTASSAACALAPSIGVLIGAGAVQGIGTAMVLPQALSLLSAAFPPDRRGRVVGIFAGIIGLATLGGPVIGGAVVQGLAWQWIFWLNVPIGIALIPLTRRHVAESFGPRTRLDVTGLALSGAGVLGPVWGLVRGNAVGWGSPQVYGPLAAGVLLLAVFAGWERRARSPMVPVSLFLNGPFVSANASGFLMTGAMFGLVFFLAEYLQAEMGQGPLAAGARMLPLTAALFLIAPVAGRPAGRLGEYFHGVQGRPPAPARRRPQRRHPGAVRGIDGRPAAHPDLHRGQAAGGAADLADCPQDRRRARAPVTAAIWILSVPLIAEFAFAPANLWTGRTIGNYTRFTGLPPWSATRVLAPVKLAAAVLLAVGLAVRALSIVGAALTVAVSGFYLARLAEPGRRDPAGLAGLAVFGVLACALLALRITT
jgi:hypothetical protein